MRTQVKSTIHERLTASEENTRFLSLSHIELKFLIMDFTENDIYSQLYDTYHVGLRFAQFTSVNLHLLSINIS